MRYLKVCLSLLSALITFHAKAQSSANTNQVKIANGVVQGTLEKSGIRSFKGVPFAAPPVGDLRWKAPQPVKNWQGVLKADHFGPRTAQLPVFGDMNFRSDGMGEDCLYLNVWTPSKTGKERLPVLVYFYGGGFVAGDGSEPRYDGESMAQKGIVALTENYRLGVFGFLSHPELTQESPDHASGNYGLLDQAAALKWVQENIAAFGGDPARVTIAGESAGSVAVSAQMASPLSKKLFAAAIGESGSILGALPAVPLSEGEKMGVEFARAAGANTLADLRAMSADSVLKVAGKFGAFRFSRTVDGYFFPRSPYEIFEAGEQAQVPLLLGWNSQEGDARGILGNEPPTKANFEKAVQKLYGDNAAEILKVYNPATDEAVEKVATALASDRFIGFSTWRWADIHARTGKGPVYRYYYEHPRPRMTPEMGNATAGLAGGVQRDANAATKPPAPPAKGAVHSAEIEYAMGNLSTNKVFAWTEDDYKVSRIMQQYFANFIKNHHPNGNALPSWPAANSTSPVSVMHINVNTRLEKEQHEERYGVLTKLATK